MKLSQAVTNGPAHQSQQNSSVIYPIRVKELNERDRRRLLMHFLALEADDRWLRFGNLTSDQVITHYVQHLDFSADCLFGVFDAELELLGAAHLSFTKGSEPHALDINGTNLRVAEFGLSVLKPARGFGIGSKLFERAAIHCRNADINLLTMHCLTSNNAMLHVAQKAGMQVERFSSEADAYLRLPPASAASILREAIAEQAAEMDYTCKRTVQQAERWLSKPPTGKSN